MNAPSPASRRVGPGVAAGITEEMIEAVVHAFYAEVRQDPDLGPIFNAAVDDWDAHLSKLCDFWSSVLLMSGRFKGAPMAAHAAIPEIRPVHFVRWLQLFGRTAQRICPPDAAALFAQKSGMIAESLQMGIAASRGEIPPFSAAAIAGARPAFAPATRLPPGLTPHHRTAEFTQETVPAGLLRAHTTKDGVWALIHVLEGRLAYRIEDPRRAARAIVLTPDTPPGVVEPTILHSVAPQGPARFYVEFHRPEAA